MYYYGNGSAVKAPVHSFSKSNADFYHANSHVVQSMKPQISNMPNPTGSINPYSNMNTMTRALKSMSNFSSEKPVIFESYYELNSASQSHPSAVLIQNDMLNSTTSSSNINASDNNPIHNYSTSGHVIKSRPSLTPDRILSVQTVPYDKLEKNVGVIYGHHVLTNRKKSKTKEPYYDYDEFIKYECTKYMTAAALFNKNYNGSVNKSSSLLKKSKQKSKNFLGDIDDLSLKDEYALAKASATNVYSSRTSNKKYSSGEYFANDSKGYQKHVYQNQQVYSGQGTSNKLKSASNANIDMIKSHLAKSSERDHSNSSHNSTVSTDAASCHRKSRRDCHNKSNKHESKSASNGSKPSRSASNQSHDKQESLSPSKEDKSTSKSKSKYDKHQSCEDRHGSKHRHQSCAGEAVTLCKKHRLLRENAERTEDPDHLYGEEEGKEASEEQGSKPKRSKSKKQKEKESASRLKLSRSRSKSKIINKLKSVSRANVLSSFKSKYDKSVSPHAHDSVASIQNNEDNYSQHYHSHHHHRHHHRHHRSQHQESHHIGCIHAQPVGHCHSLSHHRHATSNEIRPSSSRVKHTSRSRQSSKAKPKNRSNSRQKSPMVPPLKAPPPAPPIDDELFKASDNNKNLFNRLNKLSKTIPPRDADDQTNGFLQRSDQASSPSSSIAKLPSSQQKGGENNMTDSSKSSFGKRYLNESETSSSEKPVNEANLSDYLKAEKLKLRSNEACTSSTNDSDDGSSVCNKAEEQAKKPSTDKSEQSSASSSESSESKPSAALKSTSKTSLKNASDSSQSKQVASHSEEKPSDGKPAGILRREIRVGKGNKIALPSSDLFECSSVGVSTNIANCQNLLNNNNSSSELALVPISNDISSSARREDGNYDGALPGPTNDQNGNNSGSKMHNASEEETKADNSEDGFDLKKVNPFNTITENQIIATNLQMDSFFATNNSTNTSFKIIEKNLVPNNNQIEPNPSDSTTQDKQQETTMKKQMIMSQLKSKSAVNTFSDGLTLARSSNSYANYMDSYFKTFNSELYQNLSGAKSANNLALGSAQLIKLPNGMYLDMSGLTGDQAENIEFDDKFLNPIFNADLDAFSGSLTMNAQNPEETVGKNFLARPSESNVFKPKFKPNVSGPFQPVQPKPIKPTPKVAQDSQNFSAFANAASRDASMNEKPDGGIKNEPIANFKVSPYSKPNEKVRETSTIKSVANLFKLEVYKDDEDEISDDYNKYNRVKFLPSARNSLNEDTAAKLTALLNDELAKSKEPAEQKLSLDEEKLIKSLLQSASVASIRQNVSIQKTAQVDNSDMIRELINKQKQKSQAFTGTTSHQARIVQQKMNPTMVSRNLSTYSLETRRVSPSNRVSNGEQDKAFDESVSGASMRSKSMFNHSFVHENLAKDSSAIASQNSAFKKASMLSASYSTSKIDFNPSRQDAVSKEAEKIKKQKVTAFSTKNLFRNSQSTLNHNESAYASTLSTNLDASISQTSNRSENRSFKEMLSNTRGSENNIYDLINSIDADDLIMAINSKARQALHQENPMASASKIRFDDQADSKRGSELTNFVSSSEANYLKQLLSQSMIESTKTTNREYKSQTNIGAFSTYQAPNFSGQVFKPIVDNSNDVFQTNRQEPSQAHAARKYVNRSKTLTRLHDDESEDKVSMSQTTFVKNNSTRTNLNSMSSVGFFQDNFNKSTVRSMNQITSNFKNDLDNPELVARLADAKKNVINEIKSKQAISYEEKLVPSVKPSQKENFMPECVPPAPPLPVAFASKSTTNMNMSNNEVTFNPSDLTQSRFNLKPSSSSKHMNEGALAKSGSKVQENMNFYNSLAGTDLSGKRASNEAANDGSHTGLLMMVKSESSGNESEKSDTIKPMTSSMVRSNLSAFNKSTSNISLINELHIIQKKFNQQRDQPRDAAMKGSSGSLAQTNGGDSANFKYHSRSQSNLRSDFGLVQSNSRGNIGSNQNPPPLPLPPVASQVGTSSATAFTKVQPGSVNSNVPLPSNLVQALSSFYQQQQRVHQSEPFIQIKEIKLKSTTQQPNNQPAQMNASSNNSGSNALSSKSNTSLSMESKSGMTVANLANNKPSQQIPSKCSSFTNYKSINKVFTNKPEANNNGGVSKASNLNSKATKSQFSAPKSPSNKFREGKLFEKSFENLSALNEVDTPSKEYNPLKSKSEKRVDLGGEAGKSQSNTRLDGSATYSKQPQQLSHLSSTYLSCKSLFENLSSASINQAQNANPAANNLASASMVNRQKLSSNSSIEQLKNKFESASTTKISKSAGNNNSSALSVQLKESSPSSFSTSSSSSANSSNQASNYFKTNSSGNFQQGVITSQHGQSSCVNSSSTITTPSGSVNETSSNSSRTSTNGRDVPAPGDHMGLNLMLANGANESKTIVIDNEAKLNEYLKDLTSFYQSLNMCYTNLNGRNGQVVNPANIFSASLARMINESRNTIDENQVYE